MRRKNVWTAPNQPVPTNEEGETFEVEQMRELEREVARELLQEARIWKRFRDAGIEVE